MTANRLSQKARPAARRCLLALPLLTLSLMTLSLMTMLGSGCSLAPDYRQPDIATPAQWQAQAADNWQVAQPADHQQRGHWWQHFNDAELNALEQQLRSGSFDLQAAVARYDAARARASYAGSSLWPTLGVDAAVARKRDAEAKPPSGGGPGVNAYSDALLRAQLSYEVDLWGRLRDNARAADYREAAASADLTSARLSLEAELAQNYFLARSFDTLIALLSDTTDAYQRALVLTEKRYSGGIARASDVDQARVQLGTAQTQLAEAQLQRRQLQNAIAILVGKAPEEFELPVRALATDIPDVPAGLPSQLLQRRPDIASAERRVAAANADIGVARSAWFPSFRLNAIGGYESDSTGDWLIAPNRLWAVGPTAALTLFDGGARRAQTDLAWANYHETVATYRQSVINAYREVEDNLAATQTLAGERTTQHEAAVAAVRARQHAELRYQGGIALYLEVVTAQDKALTAQQQEVRIHARQLSATVQLIKALGGDWQDSGRDESAAN